jgi:hypothetical protein
LVSTKSNKDAHTSLSSRVNARAISASGRMHRTLKITGAQWAMVFRVSMPATELRKAAPTKNPGQFILASR